MPTPLHASQENQVATMFQEVLCCTYLNVLNQSLMPKKMVLWFLPLTSPCPDMTIPLAM